MLHIQIICIGKIKEKYFTDAIGEYTKRIVGAYKLNVKELPETRLTDSVMKVCEDEGTRILPHLQGGYNIAMCIEGVQKDSTALASQLQDIANRGFSQINFVIGGSFGLSEAVKAACHLRLSVSKMTFPHQLFRVMLCEQIYRATQILQGTKYHK